MPTLRDLLPPAYKQHDPADDPGPIPCVMDRLKPDPLRVYPEPYTVELQKYVIVLVPPEHTEELGHLRSDPGLMLYVNDDWDATLASLDEGIRYIEDETGCKVRLTEHHADLTYWTASPRPTDD